MKRSSKGSTRPVQRGEPDVPELTMEEFLAKRISYDGPPITDEMMREAIEKEARRRWNAKNSD